MCSQKMTLHLLLCSLIWSVFLPSTLSQEQNIYLNSLITTQPELTLPSGSVANLSFASLPISYSPDEKCTVFVKQNDVNTKKFGQLSLTVFSCEEVSSVQFHHYGARYPTQLHVKLRIQYENRAGRIVLPTTLFVTVLSPQLSLAYPSVTVKSDSNSLGVSSINGISNVISNQHVAVRDPSTCRIAINYLLDGMFPEYGSIQGDKKGGTLTRCSDFFESGIYYKHERLKNNRVPKLDFIPFVVEGYSSQYGTPVLEYFMLPIALPAKNSVDFDSDRPQRLGSAQILESQYQGDSSLVPITEYTLAVSDVFTDPNEIVFKVEMDSGNGKHFSQFGRLVYTDNPGQEVTMFTQKDVKDLKIAFQQFDTSRTTIAHIYLRAIDSHGIASERLDLQIKIRPKNPFAPELVTNNLLMVDEGKTVTLSNKYLSAKLANLPADKLRLDFRIVAPDQRSGNFYVDMRRRTDFTLTDITNNAVQYIHGGDESDSDNVVLEIVQAGTEENKTLCLLRILIKPSDDQRPYQNVDELVVEISHSKIALLTLAQLQFADADSNWNQLAYKLRSPLPNLITVIKIDPSKFSRLSGSESPVESWTQEDVFRGIVYLQFRGGSSEIERSENVRISVQDRNAIPNSDTFQLLVKIIPKDENPPRPASDCLMYMDVIDYTKTGFTKYMLSYTDEGSRDPADIQYEVLQKPYDTNTLNPLKAGSLILQRGDRIETAQKFTQFDIDSGFLKFVPPSSERGVTTRYIEFGFKVQDRYGNYVSNQVFSINLQAFDRQPPQIFTGNKRILPGGEFRVDEKFLHIYSVDPNSKPKIELISEPSLGILYLDRDELKTSLNRVFFIDDLKIQELRYRNNIEALNGDDEAEDSFTLSINDGVNVLNIDLFVTISRMGQFVTDVYRQDNSQVAINIYVAENKVTNINNAVHKYFQSVLNMTSRTSSFRNTLEKLVLGSSNQKCYLKMTRGPKTGPTGENLYGQLKVNFKSIRTNPVDSTQSNVLSCNDAVQNALYQTHNHLEIGVQPKTDEMEFDVSLYDRGDIKIDQKFILRVYILPVDSEEPRLAILSDVTVLEGKKTRIGNDILRIDDGDTPKNKLFCFVNRKPEFGYLIDQSNSATSDIPISAFKYSSLVSDKIHYVQSLHTHRIKTVEPEHDKFKLLCTDFQKSSSADVIIKVEPQSDEPPVLEVKMPLSLNEGGSIKLGYPYFAATDKDLPRENLTLNVIVQPRYGYIKLEKMLPNDRAQSKIIESFSASLIEQMNPTPGVIRTERVLYQHDGSENFKDSFRIQVTDGGPKTAIDEIPIVITPLDDEKPRLITHNDLIVKPGDVRYLTTNTLDAVDEDSSEEKITYIIKRVPMQGNIEKWDAGAEIYKTLRLGESFTQLDIELQHVVRYSQTAPISKEQVNDEMVFDITDGLNTRYGQLLRIKIQNKDFLGEKILKTILLPSTMNSTVFGDDILPVMDLDLDEKKRQLYFRLSVPPVNGILTQSGSRFKGNINTFSRDQVRTQQIYYEHSPIKSVRMDCMNIELLEDSKALGQTVLIRLFQIVIIDEADESPILTLKNMTILEGQEKALSDFIIVDTRNRPARDFSFMVNVSPMSGVLRNRNIGANTRVGDFSYEDLSQGYIVYIHNGKEPNGIPESINLKLIETNPKSAGALRFYQLPNVTKPGSPYFKFDITVLPVDDEKPKMKYSGPTKNIHYINGRPGLMLSSEYILATDEDTDDDGIFYEITRPPLNGILTTSPNSHRPVSNFSQEDINQKRIYYLLQMGTSEWSDSFEYNLADRGGNRELGLRHELMWSYLSLEKDSYTVAESSGELKIKVKRRGYLGNTAYVGLKVSGVGPRSGSGISAGGGDVLLGGDATMGGSSNHRQITFNENESEKVWQLQIADDDKHEGVEQFEVMLVDPVLAVIEFEPNGGHRSAHIDIIDDEDKPVVRVVDREMQVDESIGVVQVKLSRSGDLTQVTEVYCYTTADTAVSQNLVKNILGDFVSIPNPQQKKIVRFQPGQMTGQCEVKIVDDSLYEPEPAEEFHVTVASHSELYYIDPVNQDCLIKIIPDPKDQPVIGFSSTQDQITAENGGTIGVQLFRSGPDTSQTSTVVVTAVSYQPSGGGSKYNRATIGEDFQMDMNGVRVEFGPEEVSRVFYISILDDDDKMPMLEGAEAFTLKLVSASDASIDETKNTKTIVIDDSTTDLPKMGFNSSQYDVSESAKVMRLGVIRSGDLGEQTSVTCYAEDGSATAPNEYKSINTRIIFGKGDRLKYCEVPIVDDSKFEDSKEFFAVLKDPQVPKGSSVRASVGPISRATVLITDDDRPKVFFSQDRYKVEEFEDRRNFLTVKVNRSGDLSSQLSIGVMSADLSAKADEDYVRVDQVFIFAVGETSKEFKLEILPDTKWELVKNFELIMKLMTDYPTTKESPDIQTPRVQVDIVDRAYDESALSFPQQTKIISLKYLSSPRPQQLVSSPTSATTSSRNPIPSRLSVVHAGFPIICLTGCDLQYDFSVSNNTTENRYLDKCGLLNNSRTIYNWTLYDGKQGSFPNNGISLQTQKGVLSDGSDAVLDAAFLYPGQKVECIATAVGRNGQIGKRESSGPVEIVLNEDTLCVPSGRSTDYFSTPAPSIAFSFNDNPAFPNYFHVRATIPHLFGLIPVVSTLPLSQLENNFNGQKFPSEKTASQNKAELMCSTLKFTLSPKDISLENGFEPKPTEQAYLSSRYEFNETLRGPTSVQIYKNLNLAQCSWSFDGYFTLTDLTQLCGSTQTKRKTLKQSSMSLVELSVPVTVNFVRFVPDKLRAGSDGKSGWTTESVDSRQNLVFSYTTRGIYQNEWTSGIGTIDDTAYKGRLYLKRIVLDEFSRLHIQFKSEVMFNGCYEAQANSLVSQVFHPRKELYLDLQLLDASSCSERDWEIIASYSGLDEDAVPMDRVIGDFTGVYTVRLIACEKERTSSAQCNTPRPVDFLVTVIHQTVQGAMSEQYTYGSGIRFNSDSSQGVTKGSMVTLQLTNPDPNSYELAIYRVYICQGVPGYIPQYKPESREYGCLIDSALIQQRKKLYDTDDDPTISSLDSNQVSVNGLKVQFDSKNLFNDNDGTAPNYNHWVVQVLFYRSKRVFKTRRGSDDSEYLLHRNSRQDINSPVVDTMASVPKEAASIGRNDRGTTIAFVPFVEKTEDDSNSGDPQAQMAEVTVPIVPIFSVLAIVSIVVALVIAILLARRQKNRSRAAHYKDKCFNGHAVPPPTMLYTPVQISEAYPTPFPPVTSALKQNNDPARSTLPGRGRTNKGQVMFSPQVTTISGGEEYIDQNGIFRTFGGYMETSA